MYSLVSTLAHNEDGECDRVFGVAAGGLTIGDVSCDREPMEDLIRALNICLLPVELLWMVLENWVDRRQSDPEPD